MTPFGRRVRELRAARGVTLAQMAQALGVTPAYLSALEHGKRGQPTFNLIQGAIHHLGVIWDEAEGQVLTVRDDARLRDAAARWADWDALFDEESFRPVSAAASFVI